MSSPSGLGEFGSAEISERDVVISMSNACDPRNRPGFVAGDLTAYLPDHLPAPPTPVDSLRTVLLAWFSTVMIVAAVFGIVLFTA